MYLGEPKIQGKVDRRDGAALLEKTIFEVVRGVSEEQVDKIRQASGVKNNTKPLVSDIRNTVLRMMKEGCIRQSTEVDLSMTTEKRTTPLTYKLDDVINNTIRLR